MLYPLSKDVWKLGSGEDYEIVQCELGKVFFRHFGSMDFSMKQKLTNMLHLSFYGLGTLCSKRVLLQKSALLLLSNPPSVGLFIITQTYSAANNSKCHAAMKFYWVQFMDNNPVF